MNDKIEAKGKTVKEAVAEALLRLGARREEVIVKVMEEPKSGFLGLLGGRQAKVLVEKKRGGGRSRSGGNQRSGGKAHSLSGDDGRSRGRGRGRDSSGRRDGGGGRRSAARNEASDQEARGNRRDGGDARGEENRGGENRSGGKEGGRSNSRRRRRGSRGRGRGQRPAARTDSANAAPGNEPDGNTAPQQESRTREARASGAGTGREERRENRPSESRPNESRRNERNRRSQRGRNRGNREEVAEKTVVQAAERAPEREPERAPERTPERTPERMPEPSREPAPQAAPETRENTRMEQDRPAEAQSDTVIREGLEGTSYAKPMRDVSEADRPAALEELCSGVLVRAGFPARCQVLDGEYLQARVVTDDTSAGMLIGRHGATVDSVEHIVERMISTASGERVKMNLDINNYRRRRQDTLADRVYDAIAKVQETGEDFHMEPMDARDRRLVHLQVADTGGLTTETVIADGAKHVVISLAEGVEPKPAEDAAEEPEAPAEEAQPEA